MSALTKRFNDDELLWLFNYIERCADSSFDEIAAYLHERAPYYSKVTAAELSEFYLEQLAAMDR
jgi:hypothetical protein